MIEFIYKSNGILTFQIFLFHFLRFKEIEILWKWHYIVFRKQESKSELVS